MADNPDLLIGRADRQAHNKCVEYLSWQRDALQPAVHPCELVCVMLGFEGLQGLKEQLWQIASELLVPSTVTLNRFS